MITEIKITKYRNSLINALLYLHFAKLGKISVMEKF